jgi:hypothetical protein
MLKIKSNKLLLAVFIVAAVVVMQHTPLHKHIYGHFGAFSNAQAGQPHFSLFSHPTGESSLDKTEEVAPLFSIAVKIGSIIFIAFAVSFARGSFFCLMKPFLYRAAQLVFFLPQRQSWPLSALRAPPL